MPAIVCTDLSFSWPSGEPLFSNLSMTVAPGRTGLIGVNGSGKSTLLRLIAGRLRPSGGSVTVHGKLGYLPQDVSLAAAVTVEQALGIAEVRAALRAIENGDSSADNFTVVG